MFVCAFSIAKLEINAKPLCKKIGLVLFVFYAH